METTDFYSILQIDAQATQEEVRAAYRRLALLYHPDQSSLPQATQQMQELNQAYDVLSNQEKRAQYDEQRLAPPAPTHEPLVQADPAPPHPPPTAQAANAQAAPHRSSRTRVRHWVDQKDFMEQVRKRRIWMKNRLKLITWLILLVVVSFVWSLATGEVSIIAIIGFVLLALYLIASMFIEIKKLAR